MFDKVSHYRADVRIAGETIGTASDTTDAPFETLNKFFNYFYNLNHAKSTGLNLVYYDSDGNEFGLAEIGDCLYRMDKKHQLFKIDPIEYNLPSDAKPCEITAKLSKEVLEDIKNCLEDWTYWSLFRINKDLTLKAFEERKDRLEYNCRLLEQVIYYFEEKKNDIQTE